MTTWKESWEAVRKERHEAHDRKRRRNELELREFIRFYEDCHREQALIDLEESFTTSDNRETNLS